MPLSKFAVCHMKQEQFLCSSQKPGESSFYVVPKNLEKALQFGLVSERESLLQLKHDISRPSTVDACFDATSSGMCPWSTAEMPDDMHKDSSSFRVKMQLRLKTIRWQGTLRH
ncbi:hypothetical protein ACH5RR_041568 [Cinchona calisaya]|uniref:Uncharacterized protein n=1 Tax=Cinchona calisaya TaxID=153742 RepID=A0ABD2XWH4_9GENT